MDLRKFVVAAALGATVLTAVPALVDPQLAAADPCVYGENMTSCDTPTDPGPDPVPDPDPVPAPGPDDPAGGTPDISLPDATLPTVVITGNATPPPSYPADPGIPSYSWGGGGGGGGGNNAVVWSKGQTWNVPQNCYRNNSASVAKLSETVSYQVSYEVSTNISASAMDVLTATLGTKLNTQVTKTYGLEVTLNPSQSWTLNVEYQTVVYAITVNGYTQYVNVTQPTGVLTGSSC